MRVVWTCPVANIEREGVVHDWSLLIGSIPKWVGDWVPVFLWPLFEKKEHEWDFHITSTDGKTYSVPIKKCRLLSEGTPHRPGDVVGVSGHAEDRP